MDTVRENTGSLHERNLTVNRRSTLTLGIGGLVTAVAPTVASASELPDLKAVGPQGQVTAIFRSRDTFEVTTADGRSVVFHEADLRFKIDTSDLGPLAGQPVILPSGAKGDRATVFFASLAEIRMLHS